MSTKAHILLAERQDGVISTRQLLALGFSRNQVHIATGRWLHPLYRGVHVVGTRRVTHRGRCMAAVLAAGDGAVLSHLSAAALLRLLKEYPDEPEVTIAQARRGPAGVVVHRRGLPRGEVTRRGLIPVTTVARTILDLAADHPRCVVEEATSEAEYLKLWNPYSLPRFIENHKGCNGILTLKAMLAEGAITITKSELERRFRAFLHKRRLPLPETNVRMRLNGKPIEPDCVWREQRLIIELDGRAAHQTTSRFHGDRLRDRKLDIEAWTVWRVTARHLDDELERDLRARLLRD